jgi:hypothetical protein
MDGMCFEFRPEYQTCWLRVLELHLEQLLGSAVKQSTATSSRSITQSHFLILDGE